jgi:hypothetical protein
MTRKAPGDLLKVTVEAAASKEKCAQGCALRIMAPGIMFPTLK